MAKPTPSHQPKFNPLIIEYTAYIMQHEARSMQHAVYAIRPPQHQHHPYPLYQARASTSTSSAPHTTATSHTGSLSFKRHILVALSLPWKIKNIRAVKITQAKLCQLLVLPNHYHTLAFASLRATEFSK